MMAALGELGIATLGDLLAHPAFRHARYLKAARDGQLRRDEVLAYVDRAEHGRTVDDLFTASPAVLREVGAAQAGVLERVGLGTVAALAAFPALDEAEALVTGVSDDARDPLAPACVVPSCRKFSRNVKQFASFFKERELRDLSVRSDGSSRIAQLFNFGRVQRKVVYLGYSVSYVQEWIYLGVHLGEPQGSINLSMGQDTQVSMLDWRRAMRAMRGEDGRTTERLANVLVHQRAVDEVARATAEEHQHGATQAVGANAATAGSFVAAGAIVGAVGGGGAGALAGLTVDVSLLGTTLGSGTLGGAVVGSLVGGAAGAAAGSLIASGATTLGFVETDAEGDREIFAASGQDIQQRTVQNASSIRSFWSNVVSQSVESERQAIRTDRLTNHNRIHALNALLFEVLNGYRVDLRARRFTPLLFVPFKPFRFDGALLRDYWWLIRTTLADKKVVTLLDARYLRFEAAESPVDRLAVLPDIADVRTAKISVTVNVSGSLMQELLGAAGTFFGLGAVLGAVRMLFRVGTLLNIRASVVTTDDLVALEVEEFDLDKLAWTFVTRAPVRVDSIVGVQIHNDNGEFEVLDVEFTSLAFDDVVAQLDIIEPVLFSRAIPTIYTLQKSQRIKRTPFSVGGESTVEIPWNIGDQLRAKFEGVEAVRAELEREKAGIEDAEQAEALLLDFLNTNSYTATRFILQKLEPERVVRALEGVRLGDVPLTDIASPAPIGFCANHVVLPLKACRAGNAAFGGLGFGTAALELLLAQFADVDWRDRRKALEYLVTLRDYLATLLAEANRTGSVRENSLLARITALHAALDELLRLVPGGGAGAGGGRRGAASRAATGAGRTVAAGAAPAGPAARTVATSGMRMPDPVVPFQNRLLTLIRELISALDEPVDSPTEDMELLCGYYDAVKATLAPRMGELLATNEVSLPSPAVFMEPVLSHAKGAELYDLQRNSHWSVLPAPAIDAADPDVRRSQPVTLVPTVTAPTLPMLPPPQLPLPASLDAAIGAASRLDLGSLLQGNASSLTSMLSSLSTMATELAKASATLTGDAQQAAMASASRIAEQVSGIVGKSLDASRAGAAPGAATPAPTPSPVTLEERGTIARESTRIDQGPGSQREKAERKRTIGAVTLPDDRRDYRFAVSFLDKDGVPYLDGSFTFTLTLALFELGDVIDVGGGALTPDAGGFFMPETIPLTRGRKVKASIVADIAGAAVPGVAVLVLPDAPDVELECTMRSVTVEVQASSATEAVDTTVTESRFAAELGILLERFLNAGLQAPFGLATVEADGSEKAVGDFKAAYEAGRTTTTGGTTSGGVVRTWRVTVPILGWSIAVR